MTVGGVELDPGIGGDVVLVDSIGSAVAQVVKPAYGAEGSATLVDASHGLPVVDAAAEASLAAIATSASATATSASTTATATAAAAASLAGTLTTKVATVTTPTTGPVSASTTSATIFALNANARVRKVYNDDPASTLYLLDGSGTASTTSFSQAVPPKSLYEYPLPLYTGVVTGVWDGTPTGAARKTEIV